MSVELVNNNEALSYLVDYYAEQETILDIGVNDGTSTLYFLNFFKYSRIAAFEPVPEKFLALTAKVSKKYSNFEAYQYAVGDRRGYLRMNTDGASRIDKNGKLSVRSTTIDILNFEKVSLMNISVEGYEPYVLEGAKDTIYRCHPLILIEDWKGTYGKLLPDYELEKAWTDNHIYLYKWREDA